MPRCGLCGRPTQGGDVHEQCKQVEVAIRAYGPRVEGGQDAEQRWVHRVLAGMFLAPAPKPKHKGTR